MDQIIINQTEKINKLEQELEDIKSLYKRILKSEEDFRVAYLSLKVEV